MASTERSRRSAGPASILQGFIRSLRVQMRVVGALMIRGGLARHGHEGLGFFWMLGEPLVLSAGVMLMWSLAGMEKGHGIGLIPFALTGYTLLTLWRHVIGQLGHGFSPHAGLLFHQNVKLIDIVISNVILETLACFSAFVIAYIPLFLLDYIPMVHDPILVAAGWLFISWLSFGFGLIIASICEYNETAGHFVGPVMYVTIPATGAFYMTSWLPEPAQKIVQWSPLVHPFEMFREGVMGASIDAKFNVPFMIIVCLLLTTIGLTMMRAVQNKIELS